MATKGCTWSLGNVREGAELIEVRSITQLGKGDPALAQTSFRA